MTCDINILTTYNTTKAAVIYLESLLKYFAHSVLRKVRCVSDARCKPVGQVMFKPLELCHYNTVNYLQPRDINVLTIILVQRWAKMRPACDS